MLDIRACLIYKHSKMYDVVTFRCEQRKLSEMTKHGQLCLAVLLLFLWSVASSVPSLHVVTGAGTWESQVLGVIGYSVYEGVYEERREPEFHFKRLGEADKWGYYRFLYTDSRRPNTWILGWGGHVTTAEADYRAPAVDGRPPITGWSDVWDMSREGKEEGDPQPEIRVVGVETKITSAELRKQKRGEGRGCNYRGVHHL